MWLKLRIGQRRIRYGEIQGWRRTVAYLHELSTDEYAHLLSYWGRLGCTISRPNCWAKNHYCWHGRWYRIERAA